jgi:hypothetical protein
VTRWSSWPATWPSTRPVRSIRDRCAEGRRASSCGSTRSEAHGSGPSRLGSVCPGSFAITSTGVSQPAARRWRPRCGRDQQTRAVGNRAENWDRSDHMGPIRRLKGARVFTRSGESTSTVASPSLPTASSPTATPVLSTGS